MSRIHEALKKAEQERATLQGGAASGFPAPEESETASAAALADRVPAAAMPANLGPYPVTPGFGGQFNSDTLLSRCPQLAWKADATTMLFLNGNDSAPGTEEFRTLRSRLYHLREKRPLRKLLITSALPQEGKSFTAANLAQVMVRQHGRRALLIDADLRASTLHVAMGAPAAPGLSDCLRGEADEFSSIQANPRDNLFFMPAGRSVSNPAELLSNSRLKGLLDRIAPVFDWIIVDSPPVLPVSDANILAGLCDGVLFVVRAGSTAFDQAQTASQEFRGKNLLGFILNRVEEHATYGGSYYGYGRNGSDNS